MTRKITVSWLALLTLFPAACGRRQEAVRDWAPELRQLEMKYAPDPRLAVFRVTVSAAGGRAVVTGELDDVAAHREVLELLSRGKTAVVDRIVVLPDAGIGRSVGIVSVAVGNVRREPKHSAELVTQVLLGQVLRILKAQGGWLFVQGADRYIGWIDNDAVFQTDREGSREWNDADRVIVTGQFALLLERAQPGALPVSDLSAGDILRRVSVRDDWIEAQLPDRRTGFVRREMVEPYSAWKASRQPTAQSIEATARIFLGVPYLWGGTSARGFDCSGFVKTVFMLNGIDLLRDADQQARAGRDVDAGQDFGQLQRGDLLFFGRRSSAEKPERLWHVGIYLAGRTFIQCSGRVRISSFDPASPNYDEAHVRSFVRARRVLGAVLSGP